MSPLGPKLPLPAYPPPVRFRLEIGPLCDFESSDGERPLAQEMRKPGTLAGLFYRNPVKFHFARAKRMGRRELLRSSHSVRGHNA